MTNANGRTPMRLCLIFAACVLASASLGLRAQDDHPKISNAMMQRLHQVAELTNRERAKGGVPPLKMNDKLIAAAMAHARDMAERDYFDHRSPDGEGPGERTKREGYTEWSGENIYLGPRTPKAAVDGWMESPGHKKNILTERSKEIGVGYSVSSKGRPYWVQVFGAPRSRFPVVINDEAWDTTDRQVLVYLYGRDHAGQYRIRNEGEEFSEWQPFQSRVSWDLKPGQGRRKVIVELRADGRTLETTEDEIVLREPRSGSSDKPAANPPPRPQ